MAKAKEAAEIRVSRFVRSGSEQRQLTQDPHCHSSAQQLCLYLGDRRI